MKKGLIRIIAMLIVVAVLITALNLTTFAAEPLKKPEVSVSTSAIESTTSGISRYNPTIKLSWKKVDGANSYYIYRRDTQKGKLELIADTSKLYYKDKGLELDKTYYYKVIAYKITDGKVKAKSDSSSLVKMAVTYIDAPCLDVVSKTDNSITVDATITPGATRYYYYYSTSETGGYKCAGYTESDSYTYTNLKSSTTYYFKVRAAKEIDGKVYKSQYSQAIMRRTKESGGEYIVDFKKVPNGKELPSGSAITCLTMLFNHYGIDVDKMEMLKYVKYSDEFYYKDGELWGPDIDNYFIGDPTKEKNKYGVILRGGYLHKIVANYMRENEITTIEDDFTFMYLYPDCVKDALSQGDIILTSITSTAVPSDKLIWKTTGYGGDEYTIETPKDAKYVILCGYTDNEEYVFYDPQIDSYGKIPTNEATLCSCIKITKK